MIRVQGSIPYPPTANAAPIRQFAASLRQLSAGLQQTSGQLTGTAATASSSWTGQASQSFGQHVDERAMVVRTVASEVGTAATVLDAYAAAIDTTSAAYTAAATAEHAARAGLPWTAAALAAALAAEKAAYAAFMVAGATCSAAMWGLNARLAAAVFAGVDPSSFNSIIGTATAVWNQVSDLVGGDDADAQRDATAALDAAMWESVPDAPVSSALDPSLGEYWGQLVGEMFGGALSPETFAEQVRGGANPIDGTMAEMVADTYRVDGWDDGAQIGEWRRVTADELPPGFSRDEFEQRGWDNGLRAALYTDGSGRHVLSFAGINGDTGDLVNSAWQGLGNTPRQYDQALALTRRLSAAYGSDLVLTGHSMGGALAAYSSMGTGVPAVTYNAAGVHPLNARRVSGLEGADVDAAASARIRNYRVHSDLLTNLQEGYDPLGQVMPDAIGRQIDLDDTEPAPRFNILDPVDSAEARLRHRLRMHQADAVIEALRGQQPWAEHNERVLVAPPAGGR